MFEKLGGRKFILALIILGVGTLVQIKSAAGVNESFVALLVGIMTAFGASNAWVTSKAMGAQGPAPEAPDLSGIEERLQELAAHNEAINAKAEQIAGALIEVAKTANTASNLAKAAVGAKVNG